jgi:AcrR family transcriptional regulator
MLKEKRREQLIRSAGEVFSEKGYFSANVSDIIQRAGIARGTFYLYFDGKRQVFDSITDTLLKEIEGRLKPIDLGKDAAPPLEQLHSNLTRVLSYLLDNKPLTQILLRHAEGLGKESDQKLDRFYAKLANMIEASLKHGVEMGLMRECNTRLTTYCIIGLGKEAMRQLTSSQQGPIPDLDELLEELLSFGLQGVLLTVPPNYLWTNNDRPDLTEVDKGAVASTGAS